MKNYNGVEAMAKMAVTIATVLAIGIAITAGSEAKDKINDFYDQKRLQG